MSTNSVDRPPSWLVQALRIVVVAEWISLLLGVITSAAAPSSLPGQVLVAAILAGVFVATNTLLPVTTRLRRGIQQEILMIYGAILTVAAATLTGGPSSPYLLLALMPTLFASLVGGQRTGLTTSLFSAGLLTAVTVAGSGIEGLANAAVSIATFPLIALIVAQIRRLLVELDQRATTLEEVSAQTEAELARLNQANQLLRRLADTYGDGTASPVDVGRRALESIVDANPGGFATATMFDPNGPVVVARVGTDSPDLVRTQFPLGEGETTAGVVSLSTPSQLTAREREDINWLLRPVAVSFTNTVLLQEIAATAVREERLRLARELHDEIGPALAALGLALDATQMHTSDQGMKDGLLYVREGLGSVVDDIRGIIADLRAEVSGSLLTTVQSEAASLEPPPIINIDIHERRPPRSIAMRQIAAIVTESIRNAHQHSRARSIDVVGVVDRTSVEIRVSDDGDGFSPANLPEGHYGVLGMRERADRIAADLRIESGSAGTTVGLIWKEKR